MKPTKRISVVNELNNGTMKTLKEALVSLNANQMEELSRLILGDHGVQFSRTQHSVVANNHFRLGFIAGMLTTVGLEKDVHSALLSNNPAVREIARVVASLNEPQLEKA